MGVMQSDTQPSLPARRPPAAPPPRTPPAWPGTRVVTPGCQIGYMDHTGCHQTVFGLQNNAVKSANPARCDGEERFVHFVDIDVVDLVDADDVAVAAQQRDQAQGVERYTSCIRKSKL